MNRARRPAPAEPRGMSAFGKLWRTTTVRLTLAYAAIFTLVATLALGSLAWNSRNILMSGVRSTVEAEIAGLSEQYRQIGGVRRLVAAVEQRSRQPGSSLYLVTTFAGEALAGNIASLPPGVMDRVGQSMETPYRAQGDGEDKNRLAYVRVFQLAGGFRLVVGRDLEELERLRAVVRRSIGWSILALLLVGGAGGFLVTRRLLRRVDAMTAATTAIMAGDLAGRLPLAGSGDELDRLAAAQNAMLDRIGELMAGLREVSDNIAHDLKTPLTRLRNGAEQALRAARSPEEYREALERAIEESDGLIRVFNALLMIARAEGGKLGEGMTPFDAAAMARDVAELYEAVAEEAGGRILVDAPPVAMAAGSRELVGQAVANLIDNALKYGRTGDAPAIVTVQARATPRHVEIAVGDRGPGVPEADRERVLERFTRLDGSRSRPGYGLGLSLVAAVARLHGGRVRLEDNAPGLRVALEIPAAGAPPATTVAAT